MTRLCIQLSQSSSVCATKEITEPGLLNLIVLTNGDGRYIDKNTSGN